MRGSDSGCSADPALPRPAKESCIFFRLGLLKPFPKNHLGLREAVKRYTSYTLMIIEKQIFAGIVCSVRVSNRI